MVDLNRAFTSTQRLYGAQAFDALNQFHAVVVGIGGVGSWAAETLARSGVGRITLIDMDHIAPSNLNRQVHALNSTIGQAKVEAMRDRILQINPYCQVRCVDDFVTAENWMDWVSELQLSTEHPSWGVIDACDQLSAKMSMALWAGRLKRRGGVVHHVCVGAAGGKRLLVPAEVGDLAQVTHDPLLAQMRYRLRKQHAYPKEGKKMGLTCVFSREAVAKPVVFESSSEVCELPAVDGNLSCHGYGSSMAVTASFGMAAANFLINRVVDSIKQLKNSL